MLDIEAAVTSGLLDLEKPEDRLWARAYIGTATWWERARYQWEELKGRRKERRGK